jgi:hypothetical protein
VLYLLDRVAAERPASHTSTLLLRLINDDGEELFTVCTTRPTIVFIDFILTSNDRCFQTVIEQLHAYHLFFPLHAMCDV